MVISLPFTVEPAIFAGICVHCVRVDVSGYFSTDAEH